MEKEYISKEKYDLLVEELANKINESNLKTNEIKIYGVPKNGLIVAYTLEKYGFKVVNTPNDCDIIVDDLIDSGRTKQKYDKYQKPFFTLVEKKGKWIEFWFENTQQDMEDIIIRQFEFIGENPKRQGLLDTPKRVVKMWKEIFRGYDISQKPKITTFLNGEDGLTYDQMVTDEGLFYSQCEHHMVPFFGQYWFSYIPHPKGKILGLSKVARVVDYYSAKLQIQERLVQEVVDALWDELCKDVEYKPLGMALIMKGKHLCKCMRGVKKDGNMTSSELRGAFKEEASARNEFLKLIELGDKS